MPSVSLNLHVTVTSPNWNVKICEPYRVFKYTERGSFFRTSMIFACVSQKNENLVKKTREKMSDLHIYPIDVELIDLAGGTFIEHHFQCVIR